MTALSTEERLRYARQIAIRGIGPAGQERLKAARVFVAGLGGLGSVSAMYLAAAGIGKLTIVDRDCVAVDNLNRQILHHTADIGLAKAESAAQTLRSLNPHCQVVAIKETIDADNAVALVADSALIVDATDNIATRQVLNRASVRLGIPFVYGGVKGMDGTVATFIPGKTPCFECLFGRTLDRGEPIGVIGPAPALVGAIQSLEAIKLIVGVGTVLVNRMLCVSGWDMTFKTLRIEKDPDCPACGAGSFGSQGLP